MNLKNLNKITLEDLQKIDWSQVKPLLQSQPTLLINGVMIILTFLVLFSSFNRYTNTKQLSSTETIKLNKQLESFEKFKATEKEYSDFLSKAPKAIAGDQLIQTLSELAIRRDIQILSSSPAEKISNNLLDLTSVILNVASEDYTNIILFTHDIEKSVYPIKIGKWLGTSLDSEESYVQHRSQRVSQQTSNEPKNEYIKATITIESMRLKHD